MFLARATAVVLLVAPLAFACKTTAEALPKWDEQNPGDGDEAGELAADDPAAAQAQADAADAEEGTEVAQAETADAGAEPAGEQAAAAGDAAAQPAPAATKTLELPPAVNKKINRSCGKDPGVGQRLKSFALKTPDGKAISPGKYRGRVLLVNFWGTWCKPCLKELPEFDRLYRRYRKHGLTLVAIATDEDPEPVREFMQRRKLAAKVAIGGEAYANQYQSDKFPFSFVVDTRGVIKSSYRGYKPECAGKLEDDLRKELHKRAAKGK